MAEWSQVRLLALERDGYVCTNCGDKIVGRNAHVHHLLPRALGGKDELENLASLCATCHSARHLSLHASLGRRFIETASIYLAKLFAPEGHNLDDIDKIGIAMRYLGVERLREGQLEPILAALAGKDVLFISATGSGKSLCFQIPSLIKEGHAVVVSPLKALMADQVRSLIDRRVPATYINSDLSSGEKQLRLALLQEDKFKLLYLAPERLQTNSFENLEKKILYANAASYMVVDEAHCIDKWGDSFRPSYQKLAEARNKLGKPPVLAFTATASRNSRKIILQELDALEAEVFVQGVERPNIALLRLRMSKDISRAEIITQYYKAMKDVCRGKALVFVPTVNKGKEVQKLLAKHGLNAPFFHGKLGKLKRENLQAQFDGRLSGVDADQNDIMICTSAFGMGIDVPDIRLVFHWSHPASPEDYLQEFGRAGRDQKQSLAVLFTSADDVKLLEWMAKKTLAPLDISEADRRLILGRKVKSIEQINRMSTARERCFTRMIGEELGADPRPYPWLVKFFLNLAFTRRQDTITRKFCCDFCWENTIGDKNLKRSHFGLEVISEMKVQPKKAS